MEIYLIVFILFDNYDLTFIYVCMYFVCYQNKQDTLAGECFPVSNRTNTFDIVQLDTVSLFNLSFQRRHCLKVHAKRRAERLTIQVHYYVIKDADYHLSHIMRKPVYRTTKAQISLHIYAVWSAPLLFTALMV